MAAVAAENDIQLQQHSANASADSHAKALLVVQKAATSVQNAQQLSSQNATDTAQHKAMAVLDMAPGSQLPSADGGQSLLQHSDGLLTSVSTTEAAQQPAVAAVASTTLSVTRPRTAATASTAASTSVLTAAIQS